MTTERFVLKDGNYSVTVSDGTARAVEQLVRNLAADVLDPMENLAGAVELSELKQEAVGPLETADPDVAARFDEDRAVEFPMPADSATVSTGSSHASLGLTASEVFEEVGLPSVEAGDTSVSGSAVSTVSAEPGGSDDRQAGSGRALDDAVRRRCRLQEDPSDPTPQGFGDTENAAATDSTDVARMSTVVAGGFFARLWRAVRAFGRNGRDQSVSASQPVRQDRKSH